MQRTQSAALRVYARVFDFLILALAYPGLMKARSMFIEWWPYDLFPGSGATLRGLPVEPHLEMMVVILPSWVAGLQLAGAYRDFRKVRRDQLFFRILKGVLVGALISLTFLFLFRQIDALSRTFFFSFCALSLVLVYVSRRVLIGRLKARFQKGVDCSHLLLVCPTKETIPLVEAMERNEDWGMKIIGLVDHKPHDEPLFHYPFLGILQDLPAILEEHAVDQVYVSGRNWNVETLHRIANSCEELGVEFSMDGNFLGLRVAQADMSDFEGNTVLSFSTTPRNAEALVVKRMMDITFSAVALLLLSPVLLLTALAVKSTDSKGPVFFGQTRSGLFGRTFTMWKFRSMVSDAESRRAELEKANEMDGPVFKIARDPRVTRVGNLIRKSSIDELPQLWNVLVGEMSLVGPRPPIPAEVVQYERWQMRRLSMKPGITCIWQVSGRNNIDFQTWMKLDLQYIDNWSLLLDVKLLLKTPVVVVLGVGAR